MQINIKVIPNAHKADITFKNNVYKAYLTKPREKGKANRELINLLSDYFSIPKRSISIKHGLLAKNKIIEITSTPATNKPIIVHHEQLFQDKNQKYLGKIHSWER